MMTVAEERTRLEIDPSADNLNAFKALVGQDPAPEVAQWIQALRDVMPGDMLRYRYEPQTAPPPLPPERPMVLMPGASELTPYQPPPPGDPIKDVLGITDLSDAFKQASEGDYLPAAGSAALGAASLPFVGGPMIKGATGIARESLPILKQMMRDESGAVSVGRRGRPLEPQYPQYATEYPPNLPGVEKLKDPNNPSKGTFTETVRADETLEFAKERQRIMDDMKKYGYEKYFDPEKRFYVDPSKYPGRNVDTLSVMPKTPAKVAEYLTVIDAPETAAALRAAYDHGLVLGNAHDWYAMGQLEAAYIKEFGPKVGREKYLDEFAVPMAATTSGNSPQPNFLTAHYLEFFRKKNPGAPLPSQTHEIPYPAGGRWTKKNLDEYRLVRQGGGYSYLGADQPKMHNFARSFIGDLDRAVMDEQMSEGMVKHAGGTWPDKARGLGFGLLENVLHRLTGDMNAERAAKNAEMLAARSNQPPLPMLRPGNVQDVAWAGFRNEPGKPMIDFINDSIERTHRLTGMPREEIVRRGLLRKEIPMYGIPAGVLGTGLMSQGGSEPGS